MRFTLRILGWGLLVWLLPFVISFFVFPFRESWRSLFESVMAVAVCLAAALFGLLYIRQRPDLHPAEGLLVGVAWWLICVAVDLPLVSAGPMKMTLTEYFADIGLTYLAIPIVTTAMALSKATR